MGSGQSSSVQSNKSMVDALVKDFNRPLHSARLEGVFRAVDRAMYYDKQEGDETNPYDGEPWCPLYCNLHLSSSLIYATVVKALDLRPGMSFLNLGSGTGYLSTLVGLLIGPNGLNHGIEYHKDVVEYAYKRLEQFKATSSALDKYDFCEPTFISGNLLDFQPQLSYDRVYLGAECLPEARQFMMKLVKPQGGVLVMPYEGQLVRHVRLSECEWRTENLMGVIFVKMIGRQAPPVPAPAALTLEMPPSSARSLKGLCRIVIRQQLRREAERVNPKLANSDNFHPRKRWRRRAAERRREQLQQQQQQPAQELTPSVQRQQQRRRLLESRVRELDPSLRPRVVKSRRRSGQQEAQSSSEQSSSSSEEEEEDENDDEDDNWNLSLRSFPRRLFNRPLGGASSALPFRAITLEDILSGRPPLSDLMRYRPGADGAEATRARRRRSTAAAAAVNHANRQLEDLEEADESDSSAGQHENNNNNNNNLNNIEDQDVIIVDSDQVAAEAEEEEDSVSGYEDEEEGEGDEEGAQAAGVGAARNVRVRVGAHEASLRNLLFDLFRNSSPLLGNTSGSSSSSSSTSGDSDSEEHQREQLAHTEPRRQHRGTSTAAQAATTSEDQPIASRLRSRQLSNGSSGGGTCASASTSTSSSQHRHLAAAVAENVTTLDGSSGARRRPVTRGSARPPTTTHAACPVVAAARSGDSRAAAGASTRITNCSLTPAAAAAAGPSGGTQAARASTSSQRVERERKRKRQSCRSSASSASSSSSSGGELDEQRPLAASSSSISSSGRWRGHAAPGRVCARHRARCRRHCHGAEGAALLGLDQAEREPAHTGATTTPGQAGGGTSVAVDSRGVVSTMTTRVIMLGQDGASTSSSSGSWLPPTSAAQNNASGRSAAAAAAAAAATASGESLAESDHPRRPPDCKLIHKHHRHLHQNNHHHHHSHRHCRRRTCRHLCRACRERSRDTGADLRGAHHHQHRLAPSSAVARELLRRRRQRARAELERRAKTRARRASGPAPAWSRSAAASSAGSGSGPARKPWASTAAAAGGKRARRPRLSECEKYRSYMRAFIGRLPLPRVLHEYLNHDKRLASEP